MCKHDQGFTHIFWKLKGAEYMLGAWTCNLNCGYCLNFDPFTHPHGIAYVVKENNKPGPKLIGEGHEKTRTIK